MGDLANHLYYFSYSIMHRICAIARPAEGFFALDLAQIQASEPQTLKPCTNF